MLHNTLQTEIQIVLDELSSGIAGYGIQVAAYANGEQVINASSGTTDSSSGTLVHESTLFNSQSCSKGVTATVIHILAQQGKLQYDDPVTAYWPAFAANGKENITIRQVLLHQAGIPHMPDHTDMELLCNWEAMIYEIEQLTPIWEPGTKTGYHGLTFGWILGEVAARADGRFFSRIVREEIGLPLGIQDEMYFGAPVEEEHRIAKLNGEELPLAGMPDDMLFKKVLPPSVLPIRNPGWNERAFYQAVVPAVGGMMTANALARMYASLMGNGVKGVRLLSPESVQEASRVQSNQTDEVFSVREFRSLGYSLGNPEQPNDMGSSLRTFGHSGTGGMIGYADPDHHFSMAILKNHMMYTRDDQAQTRIMKKVRELLGHP